LWNGDDLDTYLDAETALTLRGFSRDYDIQNPKSGCSVAACRYESYSKLSGVLDIDNAAGNADRSVGKFFLDEMHQLRLGGFLAPCSVISVITPITDQRCACFSSFFPKCKSNRHLVLCSQQPQHHFP